MHWVNKKYQFNHSIATTYNIRIYLWPVNMMVGLYSLMFIQPIARVLQMTGNTFLITKPDYRANLQTMEICWLSVMQIKHAMRSSSSKCHLVSVRLVCMLLWAIFGEHWNSQIFKSLIRGFPCFKKSAFYVIIFVPK